MNKITKKDLAELVASKVNCTKKDANEVVNAIFDEITATIKKGDVADISGFGKFVLKERKASVGRTCSRRMYTGYRYRIHSAWIRKLR